jgi:hypothetical protein
MLLVSTIDVASVTDVENRHELLLIVNIVYHAIVPDPDAPSLAAGQLKTTGRPGILGQSADGIADPLVDASRQLC